MTGLFSDAALIITITNELLRAGMRQWQFAWLSFPAWGKYCYCICRKELGSLPWRSTQEPLVDVVMPLQSYGCWNPVWTLNHQEKQLILRVVEKATSSTGEHPQPCSILWSHSSLWAARKAQMSSWCQSTGILFLSPCYCHPVIVTSFCPRNRMGPGEWGLNGSGALLEGSGTITWCMTAIWEQDVILSKPSFRWLLSLAKHFEESNTVT